MKKIYRNKKIILFAIIIAAIHVGLPVSAFAGDQGVPIGDTGRVRQELQPFVIINKIVVLDPETNELILLFPGEEVEKRIQPEIPEVETEKKVFPKTHSETEIGTITIKTKWFHQINHKKATLSELTFQFIVWLENANEQFKSLGEKWSLCYNDSTGY